MLAEKFNFEHQIPTYRKWQKSALLVCDRLCLFSRIGTFFTYTKQLPSIEGLLRPRMTELDCSTAINAVIDTLDVPLETPKGRQRHLEKLKWPMYLMLLPNKRRPTKEEFKAPYRQQQQQREV
jgi:hypothetical protein